MSSFETREIDAQIVFVKPTLMCIAEGEQSACFAHVGEQIQAGKDLLLELEVLSGDCSAMVPTLGQLAQAAEAKGSHLAIVVPNEVARRSLSSVKLRNATPIFENTRNALFGLGSEATTLDC